MKANCNYVLKLLHFCSINITKLKRRDRREEFIDCNVGYLNESIKTSEKYERYYKIFKYPEENLAPWTVCLDEKEDYVEY